MRHHVINFVIGLGAFALAVHAHFAAPKIQTVIQPIQQATPSGKINPYAWGELDQTEIDALQHRLEAMERMPVVIFCNDGNCGDIALNFDNAFESAHWSSDIQRPMIDNSVGIWTSSQALADAIDAATGGRLKAKILGPEWKPRDKIALAIGRKPR